MKHRSLLLILGASMALSAFSQQTKILTAEKHNEYGLVYSLPTTALRITVTATRETRKAAPFRQYAKKYLGTSNVIEEDATSCSIKEIQVVPIGVKDDDTQYLMQLKAGALTYICVASDGMLLGINTKPDATSDDSGKEKFSTPTLIKDGGGVDDYLRYIDMDFVSAQNSMRQAEMVASSLMDVRDAYLSLTRGTADNVPTDGKQLELMLNSLKEQEAALTRAFTGSVSIEEFSAQYIYIPEEEGEEVLFRLSDFSGLTLPEDLSGIPIYIKTEVMMEGKLPLDVNGEEKKFPKDGVVYAIPGTAKISIYSSEANFVSKEMEFAQFGTRFALSPSLFTDKKTPSYAVFSPVTGALEEIGKVVQSE